MSAASAPSAVQTASATTPQLQVFFDGACPVCSRQVAVLRRRDRRQQIEFIDIAAPGFDAAAWGREASEFMAAMHARLPDGSWAVGVEAIRRIYRLLGFGWLVALSRLPGVRQLLDAAYRDFARRRTRRPSSCAAGGGCGHDVRRQTER